MTQNTQQPINPWTEKHDEFCLKHSITPAAKLLWQWLAREGKLGEELEPDLQDFNNWIQKSRGKGYCRPTLKSALAQLIEHRVISLVKQYTWRVVKIITRPLDWLKPKKNLRKHQEIYDSSPSNPQNSNDKPYSSSDSMQTLESRAQILVLCGNHGIYFHPEKPAEVFNHSFEEVEQAIQIFYQRGGHEKIQNPPGFINDCLTWQYWTSPVDLIYNFVNQVTNLTPK